MAICIVTEIKTYLLCGYPPIRDTDSKISKASSPIIMEFNEIVNAYLNDVVVGQFWKINSLS